jgi:hypothetical protein
MFKGNNTLLLNEATMIEAVQEYLRKRTLVDFKPTVKSVKFGINDGYIVTLVEDVK